jgi:hypothetical protein
MIELPKECVVDKFIPKKIFYEKVSLSSNLKQEFVDKIDKIYWKYKISEDTLNISKTENVEEIEIFELTLKEKANCQNIIKVITRNIPYVILFEIYYNDEVQYAIKHNDDFYFTNWNEKIDFNFNGIDLNAVYENIIRSVTNISEQSNNIDEELEKDKKLKEVQKEIERLENKMKAEKQFNKKVELNKNILKLKNQKEELSNNGE